MTTLLLLMVVPMLFALWAQWRVRTAFESASQVPAACGMTGAEISAEILRAHDIHDVRIEQIPGQMSDHYDPHARVLRLSPDVYNGRSVASVGIAAHEAGHAIQDASHYAPLKFRNGIVPLATVGSNTGVGLISAGMMLAWVTGGLGRSPVAYWLVLAGVVLFSAVVLFQLINLPVEFDASRRARQLMQSTGLIAQGPEAAAMNHVLSAAAMTYVAATVGAIATLLYYLILLSGRRD